MDWDQLGAVLRRYAEGDAWFDAGASVALRVPSVVVSGEFNLLLNPEHPDMSRVTIGNPTSFLFDPRLAD